jgi:hypothetical protein
MRPHVILGLVPGTYPLGRPVGVWAPHRVDARHTAAHDDGGGLS